MKKLVFTIIKLTAIITIMVLYDIRADTKRIVDLPAKDIVYDPVTQMIYASVTSNGGIHANSIARINPLTGSIDTSVFIGSEPGVMAISDDGHYIYVSLDAAAAVRRFNIDSMSAGIQFILGSDPFLGTHYAEDIEVQPGQSNVIAVSLKYLGSSPKHAGVAIYENGIKRSVQTPFHTGSNVIEFGTNPSRLYGYNNETTEFGFRRMEVSAAGVTILDVTTNLISNFYADMKFSAGRMYSTTGRVFDPESKIILGTFALTYLYEPVIVEPDGKLSRAFFLARNYNSIHIIRSYNTQTFALADTMTVDSVSGTAYSLIRWGTNGLSFRTSSSQIVILTTSLITDIRNENVTNPSSFSLSQNYPNPFNPVTNLEFGISDLGFVSLKVYDILGKEVVTLVNEKLSPGKYKVEFDGSRLTSGVYFYRLTAGEFTDTKRMMLIK